MRQKKTLKKEMLILSFLALCVTGCESMKAPSSKGSVNPSSSSGVVEDGYVVEGNDGQIRGAASDTEQSPFERGDGVLPDSLGSGYEDVLPPI